jgi:DNA topoisomerase-1
LALVIKPKFLKNFWEDWKAILRKNHRIKKFELNGFTPIYDWAQAEKERKKNMSLDVI